MEERDKKLPKWAQKRIEDLEFHIRELESLREAHSVLSNREWFTVRGPNRPEDPEVYKLFTCSSDGTFPVCSLYKGDTLLVGRNMDRWPVSVLSKSKARA